MLEPVVWLFKKPDAHRSEDAATSDNPWDALTDEQMEALSDEELDALLSASDEDEDDDADADEDETSDDDTVITTPASSTPRAASTPTPAPKKPKATKKAKAPKGDGPIAIALGAIGGTKDAVASTARRAVTAASTAMRRRADAIATTPKNEIAARIALASLKGVRGAAFHAVATSFAGCYLPRLATTVKAAAIASVAAPLLRRAGVGSKLAAIVPVPVEIDGEIEMFVHDEGIRPDTTSETLANLKPAFDENGKITAGNSSQISDGAAAVLIMSREKADELGLKPRARFTGFALAGTDPVTMLKGPIPVTEKVLAKTGLSVDDIDLFEINEAFASVVLAWQKETGADLEKVNVNGGAIALGHPLGCSGAKLMTTLVNELERTGGRYGMQAMCEGGGLANGTIIERIDS